MIARSLVPYRRDGNDDLPLHFFVIKYAAGTKQDKPLRPHRHDFLEADDTGRSSYS